MTTLASRLHDGRLLTSRAVATGALAAICVIVLLQAPLIWTALVTIGLLVAIGSLLVPNARNYWLAVYVVTIPLNITKLFYWTPDSVAVLKHAYGIYVNETMVPQMYLADLPLAMLLVLWLGTLIATRRSIEVPRGFALIAGFVLWCLAGIVLERAPLLGISWTVYELKLMVVCLWFVNAKLDRRAVRLVVAVLLASLALQSAVTFYSYYRQTGSNVFGSLFGIQQTTEERLEGPARGSGAAYVYEQGNLRRGTGTIGTANLEAKYFVLLLPLALVTAIGGRRPSARVGGLLVCAVGGAALYLTYSRGALLTAGLAMGLAALLLARRRLWSGKALALWTTAGTVGLVAASPWLLRFFGSRPGYTMARFDQLVDGLQIWWQHPIAGVGMNNFNLWVSRLDYNGIFGAAPIHNHYLRIAIETGAVGFLLYFGFFVLVLRTAYHLTRAADPFIAGIAIAVFSGLCGTAVYFADDLFYDPIIRTQIWISIALVFVLGQLSRSAPAPTPAGQAS